MSFEFLENPDSFQEKFLIQEIKFYSSSNMQKREIFAAKSAFMKTLLELSLKTREEALHDECIDQGS